MKIKYLGTAAAEGIPALFCACETCKRALKYGGKNVMTRSQALIDDGLLIDFNSDTYMHFLNMRRTLVDVEYVLITHSHTDHFTFEENFCRFEGIAHNVKKQKLSVYLSKGAYEKMVACTKIREEDETARNKRFEYIIVEPYKPFYAGEYLVTPLPAVHMLSEQALIYLIEKDGKAIFYGNDTGVFPTEIDDYLIENKKKIDLLSLDCTMGELRDGAVNHMSMNEGKRIADRFAEKGLLSDNALLYYNHFSHNIGMIYDELKKAAEKYGLNVTYDGLELTV